MKKDEALICLYCNNKSFERVKSCRMKCRVCGKEMDCEDGGMLD